MCDKRDQEENDSQDANSERRSVATSWSANGWHFRRDTVVPVDDDSCTVGPAWRWEIWVDIAAHVRRLGHCGV